MRLTHYSAEPLGKVMSADQQGVPMAKPNGLWVSVEGEDDWPSWCRGEGFRLEKLACNAEIILADDALILHLESCAEIDRFNDQFKPARPRYDGYEIEWWRVAWEYQGIIIAPYQWERRNAFLWYYGWDAASGCIWDARAIADVRLQPTTGRQVAPEELAIRGET